MRRSQRGATLRKARGSTLEDDFTRRLVTVLDPTSAASEAYRSLRTNLIYALVDAPPKVIVLTSPNQGEGKSTTCANMGVVLAQADKSTLIIDCDLRRPVIHKFFDLRNLRGLMDVLVGEARLREVAGEPMEGLTVLPVGPIPPNPAETLSSEGFSEFLTMVREEYDYVLIDASPVGLVSDPTIIASEADGVLLVLDAQNTRKRAVRRAMHSLEAVGANMLGTVMNNIRLSKDSYYYNNGYYTL